MGRNNPKKKTVIIIICMVIIGFFVGMELTVGWFFDVSQFVSSFKDAEEEIACSEMQSGYQFSIQKKTKDAQLNWDFTGHLQLWRFSMADRKYQYESIHRGIIRPLEQNTVSEEEILSVGCECGLLYVRVKLNNESEISKSMLTRIFTEVLNYVKEKEITFYYIHCSIFSQTGSFQEKNCEIGVTSDELKKSGNNIEKLIESKAQLRFHDLSLEHFRFLKIRG